MKKVVCFVLFFASLALSQEFRGSIRGRILDPSGAAVPGAAIEVINTETNVETTAVSNEAGNYQVPFLLPGNYAIRVEHAGFKTLERQGVRVSLNEQVTLDLTLELGQATESVTVTASAPLLTTASADLGQVIERRMVETMVVSLSRNVINLRNLAPGVTGGTGTYTSSAQGDFSIAGGGSTRGDNEIVVDGIPSTTVDGTIGFVPALDAVDEVKVHTTMFDAALGHSNGGAVTITTRGGTNELHGSAYLYKRWAALNANSWTNNRLGLPKPPVTYHQWGYAFSGPVYAPRVYDGRNRTFFSTTLERDHDARALTRQARVPNEAERKGDFSQTLNRLGGPFAIFDPATTVVEGTRASRQPFPGAIIPPSRFSPIGAAVLGKYPLPNQPARPQIAAYNWALSKTYSVDQHQYSGRVDHAVSDRQRLFVRIGVLDRIQMADELIFGAISFPVSGGSDLERPLARRRFSLAVDDTIMVSPTLVGSIRLGVLSYTSRTESGAAGADPKELNIPDIIVRNQAFRGWPNFSLGENLPDLGSGRSFSRQLTNSLVSTWTKLAGEHSFKFGVDYRMGRINSVSPGSNAVASFSFNPVFTQANPFDPRSADASGSGMASLLLGLAASGNFGYNTATSTQNHYIAWFFQDDWKLTRRLTVNLGLRYELETPFTERYNRMGWRFDETARLPAQPAGMDLRGGILFAGVDGNPRRQGADKNNFGPRVGFAWQVAPRTVIRGGYGIFYSVVSMNTTFFGSLGVWNAVTPYVGTVDNGATPYTTLADPFPQGLRQPLGSSVGLMAQVGDGIGFLGEPRINPYNGQWQFSIQQELPARTLLEVAYMGMHSVKQPEGFNLNERPDIYLVLGAEENRRVPNPFFGLFPPTSTLGQSSTITQNRLWVRFPQFTTVTLNAAPTGRALYHALHAKADKRLTHGLTVLWTYSFSRLMDNNTTSIVNPRFYRAVSPFDQKHVTRLALVYQLPVRLRGAGLQKVWDSILGGWSVSGLAQFATGTPLSVTHAYGRPLRIRTPKLSGPVHQRLGDQRDPATGRILNPYFDVTAFEPLPNQYTVTPEPPALDELRAPGTRSLNAAFFKTIPLRERLRLEIRLDATGLTNTPNFAAPGTNMSQAATFGVITSAGGSRSMQGSARIAF